MLTSFPWPSSFLLVCRAPKCKPPRSLRSITLLTDAPPFRASMATRRVRYAVIDAFTGSPFKGNPAAVCLLDSPEEEAWMQSVAAEFNTPATAFVSRAASADSSEPRFSLRWFTPVAEMNLCGHATLAVAHFLWTSGLVNGGLIEFDSMFGTLTAKKVIQSNDLVMSSFSPAKDDEKFSVELDFPVIPIVGCDGAEAPLIPETLNGASITSLHKTTTAHDLIVELCSAKEIVDLHPNYEEIKKCAGRGLIVTAPAPAGSGFDFFTRFFCPKFGINEDPVCGSAHCALAPYWSKKLGKDNLVAYMASTRGGRLDLQMAAESGRIRIRGEATTVMIGSLFV